MLSILGKINYGLIIYFNSYEYMNESVKGVKDEYQFSSS
jgi:Rad3-related DNA helicase